MHATKKSNPFLGSLRQVAIAIGKREKISIVFKGSGAKTDGRTIYLPETLPADDSAMEITLRGYLDHEVGHIKHTDFELPTDVPALVHTITNVVEDIRIEQAMGAEYPGCAVNLRELVCELKDSGTMKVNKRSDYIAATLMAISYGARVKHLRNALHEEAAAYRELAEKHLGPTGGAIVDMAIDKAGSLSSTLEARDLATEIYNLLKQASQEQPQPQPQQQSEQQDQQQGEGQGEGSSEKEEESSDEAGEPDSAPGQGENGTGDDSHPGEGGDESGHGAGGGSGQDSQDNASNTTSGGASSGEQPSQDDASSEGQGQNNKPGPSDLQRENLEKLCDASSGDMEKAAKALDIGQQAAHEINKDSKESDNSPQSDSYGNTGEVDEVKAAGRGNGKHILNEARKTAGLRGKLAGLFQASKLKRDNPKLVGIKIDQRAVHRVAALTPDTRIFQQRREKTADNTAIVILADKSGSTSHVIGLITAAAYSVAKATESMPGVKCAVAAYPHMNAEMVRLKGFDEKSKPERFDIGASGGTPTDVALRWAGQKLWPRQEDRKIVLVLTDGEPNNPGKTREMAQLLVENNIECYGIGIGEGTGWAVSRLFGEQSTKEITDISELANAMFDTMAGAITRKR